MWRSNRIVVCFIFKITTRIIFLFCLSLISRAFALLWFPIVSCHLVHFQKFQEVIDCIFKTYVSMPRKTRTCLGQDLTLELPSALVTFCFCQSVRSRTAQAAKPSSLPRAVTRVASLSAKPAEWSKVHLGNIRLKLGYLLAENQNVLKASSQKQVFLSFSHFPGKHRK